MTKYKNILIAFISIMMTSCEGQIKNETIKEYDFTNELIHESSPN